MTIVVYLATSHLPWKQRPAQLQPQLQHSCHGNARCAGSGQRADSHRRWPNAVGLVSYQCVMVSNLMQMIAIGGLGGMTTFSYLSVFFIFLLGFT